MATVKEIHDSVLSIAPSISSAYKVRLVREEYVNNGYLDTGAYDYSDDIVFMSKPSAEAYCHRLNRNCSRGEHYEIVEVRVIVSHIVF